MNKHLKSNTEIFYVYSLGPKPVKNQSTVDGLSIEVRNVELKIRKTAHNYFYKPGDELKYSLLITNVGNWVSEEVFVVDDLKNLHYIEDSCRVIKDCVVIDDIVPHISDEHITFEIGNI